MGKFSGLFKKSDDKQKPASPAPSNPYASPSVNPYAQPSPPTQHQQYNSDQYRDNQRVSPSSYGAPSYGSSSGLPSGPRPGGLPARVNQGLGAWGSDHDAQSAPPSYSERPDGGSTVPSTTTSPSVVSSGFGHRTAPKSNQASPALTSGAPSPAFGSKTASPLVGTGYPSEKYGAADGIGRNRFDAPAQSRQDQFAPPTSQRPGGYGNLDSAREELFSGYNHNQGIDSSQYQAPGLTEPPVDRSMMTEEERDEADARDIKREIDSTNLEAQSSLQRSLAMMREGHQKADDSAASFARQREQLFNAARNVDKSAALTQQSERNIKVLARTQYMLSSLTDSKDRTRNANEAIQQQLQEKAEKEDRAREWRQDQQAARDMDMRARVAKQTLGSKPDPSQRQKFMLEAEDEEFEERFEAGQEELYHGVVGLKEKMIRLGEDLDAEKPLIDSLNERTSRAHDGVIRTTHKLGQF